MQFWHAEGATGWPEQEIAAVDRNAWYITPLKLFPEWHRSGQSEGFQPERLAPWQLFQLKTKTE